MISLYYCWNFWYFWEWLNFGDVFCFDYVFDQFFDVNFGFCIWFQYFGFSNFEVGFEGFFVQFCFFNFFLYFFVFLFFFVVVGDFVVVFWEIEIVVFLDFIDFFVVEFFWYVCYLEGFVYFFVCFFFIVKFFNNFFKGKVFEGLFYF